MLSTVAVLALVAWLVLASPVLAVREVGVVGAERLDPAQVRELTADAVGTPLARVDTAEVAERVAALPLVRTVEVVRAWPRTLEVRLVERVPVAALPAGPAFRLVDADAVLVMDVPEAPADLPVVEVGALPEGAPSLDAATDVLGSLPEELRADVERVVADTPDEVRLHLRDGGEVLWGGPADSELKSRVLQALRSQDADVYDVSAPLTPVTR